MELWQNQQEALDLCMQSLAAMLDMDMGTGKTRVAIETAIRIPAVRKVLVVCPKAVIPVWGTNLRKFYPDPGQKWGIWEATKGTVEEKARQLREVVWYEWPSYDTFFVVVNYDIVWRKPLSDTLLRFGFDMAIMDESHRIKAASSKVSRFAALLGKRVFRRLCLSGTPMSNSPLDVYGQYRFLDPKIYGTNFGDFKGKYAIMNGANPPFIIGYKNQEDLMAKFRSIAYTCKMSDIKDRLNLPDKLPPVVVDVQLPHKDALMSRRLAEAFVAECQAGIVSLPNVLHKQLRLQQITSGFTMAQDAEDPLSEVRMVELNTSKEDALADMLEDVDPKEHVVVFCTFKHDLQAVKNAVFKADLFRSFELSGAVNELQQWKQAGGVLAVQIQAGAEGVDMSMSNLCVYFSLPNSLALYEQSMARLYRPGQTRPVSFRYMIAQRSIDVAMYKSLRDKKDLIDGIKDGSVDFGYVR